MIPVLVRTTTVFIPKSFYFLLHLKWNAVRTCIDDLKRMVTPHNTVMQKTSTRSLKIRFSPPRLEVLVLDKFQLR